MSANIAYLGVAGSPIRAHAVEQLLIGSKLDAQTLEDAAGAARDVVSEDMGDVHATVEYRRELAAEMTRRALKQAWERRERQEGAQ